MSKTLHINFYQNRRRSYDKKIWCVFMPHSVYNVDLTSKASEEIVSESTENCPFRQRHCCLTLYCEKLESLGYIFVADSAGLSSFKFSL